MCMRSTYCTRANMYLSKYVIGTIKYTVHHVAVVGYIFMLYAVIYVTALLYVFLYSKILETNHAHRYVCTITV